MFVVIVGAGLVEQERLGLHRGLVALDVDGEPLDLLAPGVVIFSTSPTQRARWLLYVGDDSVGVEPSVV